MEWYTERVTELNAASSQPLLATTPAPEPEWQRVWRKWWGHVSWVVGLIFVVVVAIAGAGWGLRWWQQRQSQLPQTYQQCVAAGGRVVGGDVGAGCEAADGTFFAQPPEDPLTAERQPSARELEQQAAQARGEQIFYHDELGFKVTAPVAWQGLVTAAAVDQSIAGDFHPAVTLRSPTADAVQKLGVVEFSQPVAIAGPHVGWGSVAAGGLSGVATHPQIANSNPAVVQSNQVTQESLAGLPMVVVKRQYTQDLGGISAGPGSCGGCWTKLYYFETPGQMWQVKATWRPEDLGFEAVVDRIVQSRLAL